MALSFSSTKEKKFYTLILIVLVIGLIFASFEQEMARTKNREPEPEKRIVKTKRITIRVQPLNETQASKEPRQEEKKNL